MRDLSYKRGMFHAEVSTMRRKAEHKTQKEIIEGVCKSLWMKMLIGPYLTMTND